jgi:hypothetical protein
MRRQLFATFVFLVGLASISAVLAQPVPVPPSDPSTPPRTLPPLTSGVIPASGTAPVPISRETTLSKLEPLAAYPMTTQQSVRSVLYGSNWLTRMNQPQGRFTPGYIPALRQPMEGDHDLKQAQAALALAQAAKFAGDDRQNVVASQAVLTLLAATKADPSDPNCRVPVRSSMSCNRVGFAAVLALAIYDLPAADESLRAEAEKLCEFIRKQLRPDGSIHYCDSPTDVPTQLDPAGVNEYPGFALQALATSNRLRPAEWKLEALRKSLPHYRAWFKSHPHPMLAATLTPAFAELYFQTKLPDASSAVFEMNDWLVELQYRTTDPRRPVWAGGFKGWVNGQTTDAAPGVECGMYLQSISCAFQVNRLAQELNRDEREARYRQSATDAAQFLSGLQYLETNTRHFADGFRSQVLIGGFYLSTSDGNLRIDATAIAITGMIRFLGSGAEK